MISASTETKQPDLAARRYENYLTLCGKDSVENCAVMVFGYGDYFGIAIELLQRGAAHVYLCDKYTTPDNKRNVKLYETNPEYVWKENGDILPNPEYITLIQDDIQAYVQNAGNLETDLVLSSGVLEHVDQVEETISALARITTPDGIHIHFVDLRDHYFKYPFQMLVYSKETWERFLKANNLNRLRLKDYERIFNQHFGNVQCKILNNDLDSYLKIKEKIRPEFITGDDQIDSAAHIIIMASKPLRGDTVQRNRNLFQL